MVARRVSGNTGLMTGAADRAGLRRLASQASSDDRAWHALVQALRLEVDDELARHGLVGAAAEAARRATWRSLALRTQLGSPEDVRSWIRQRAALEAHLVSFRASAEGAEVERRHVSRPRREERRSGSDRRTGTRSDRDRRRPAQPPRSPDSVAAEILRSRTAARD